MQGSFDRQRGSERSKEGVSLGVQTERPLSMFCSSSSSVLLQTARCNVSCLDKPEKVYNVRIILDSGSARSYVTDVLRESLNLKSLGRRQVKISRFMDGEGSGLEVHSCDIVQLKVHGIDSDDVVITAYSVPTICPPPESQAIRICKAEYSHLSDLNLSDEAGDEAFRDDCIDIMIGND